MTRVLLRDTHRETHGKKGSSHVKRQVAVMRPQAKECLQQPDAGRGGEAPAYRAFGGSVALTTL